MHFSVFVTMIGLLFVVMFIYQIETKDKRPVVACEERDEDIYILYDYRITDEYYIMSSGRSFEKNQCNVQLKD